MVSLGLTGLAPVRFEYSQTHMGVSVDITLYAESQQKAEAAAGAAFQRFADLDGIMSDYQKDSELNRLANSPLNTPVKLSPDLYVVLTRSLELARLSGGAFDITAGPIIRRWRKVRDDGVLPWPSEIKELKRQIGWQSIVLDPKKHTATLTKRLKLDLGGIAKGYACDAAIAVLKKQGVTSALVEAGGDISISNPPPDKKHWTISVRGWKEPLFAANCGVSTSGDTEQYVEIGGRRYSHIVDPRSGTALTSQIQVTVVAKTAFTADGLSTTCSVLGIGDRSDQLAEHYGARLTFIEGVQPLRGPEHQ